MARNRYIQAVQDYNVTVRSFPSNVTAMAFVGPQPPVVDLHSDAGGVPK